MPLHPFTGVDPCYTWSHFLYLTWLTPVLKCKVTLSTALPPRFECALSDNDKISILTFKMRAISLGYTGHIWVTQGENWVSFTSFFLLNRSMVHGEKMVLPGAGSYRPHDGTFFNTKIAV